MHIVNLVWAIGAGTTVIILAAYAFKPGTVAARTLALTAIAGIVLIGGLTMQLAMVTRWSQIALPREIVEPVPRDCSACPEMIVVHAGDYARAGADATSPSLRLWPGFAISRREISQAEYDAFLTATKRIKPACMVSAKIRFSGRAVCLTASDARAYASWLSAKGGHRYRLPTAIEWGYAAFAQREPRPLSGTDLGLIGSADAVTELVDDCSGRCRSQILPPHMASGATPAGTVGFRIVRDLDLSL